MGGVVFLLAGADPFAAYAVMARGAFGSLHDLSEVVVKAIPLMLCGLAVAVAAKIQVWNVGGEGQLVLGGIGAAGVALFLGAHLPSATILSLSGGLAGLAGMAEVSGIHYRLQQGLAVGYGYTGIIVAWLAQLHPVGIILTGFFIASLLVGGDQLQTVMHLPSAVGLVLEGTLLFFVLGSDLFSRYRVHWGTPRP